MEENEKVAIEMIFRFEDRDDCLHLETNIRRECLETDPGMELFMRFAGRALRKAMDPSKHFEVEVGWVTP